MLEGAGELLSRVGVIRAEVCFIPFRVGQKLFSHVDLLLRDHGFDLLRFEIEPNQVGCKMRDSPSVFGPALAYPDRYGQPLSGDAVYVNRSIEGPERALAQAAVLIDKNHLGEALFVLDRRADVVDEGLRELLRTYEHRAFEHRLLAGAMTAARRAGKLRHPLFRYRTDRGRRELGRRQRRGPASV